MSEPLDWRMAGGGFELESKNFLASIDTDINPSDDKPTYKIKVLTKSTGMHPPGLVGSETLANLRASKDWGRQKVKALEELFPVVA